jgi:hypothetical protein
VSHRHQSIIDELVERAAFESDEDDEDEGLPDTRRGLSGGAQPL